MHFEAALWNQSQSKWESSWHLTGYWKQGTVSVTFLKQINLKNQRCGRHKKNTDIKEQDTIFCDWLIHVITLPSVK